ncbi:MAG: hypothetical protein ACTHJR_13550 [Sphingomonas sp.]|uniref:hypothetical protein n=1 Tax=Sphingomonas sp. TaxID=28214 RepID=UPI003F811FD3
MTTHDAIAWGMNLVVIALALGCARIVQQGLRTGVARGRYGRKTAKADDPADYWRKIWMVGGSAVVLALFALALTIRLIVRGAD